jgi:uncharacterized protein
MADKFEKLKKIVEKKLSCSAHNIDHITRVYNLCIYLAKQKKKEIIDLDVLKTSALLHDIARVEEDNDKTRKIDHAILGAEISKDILKRLKFSDKKIEHIQKCIISHRNRTDKKPESIEAKILYDADKLDCIGVIGIGRSFLINGKQNQHLYIDVDINEYFKKNIGKNGKIKNLSKHSPNLEYELKLKSIPDKLHTKEAKKIAKKRMRKMKIFFKDLKEELDMK